MREINGGVVRAINQENHPCVPPSAPPPTPTPNTTQSPGVEWRELARPGLHLWCRDPDLWRSEAEEEARLAAAPQRRCRTELCVTN